MQPTHLPQQPSHRPLILVVDDEIELRRCIELLLEEEGYAVLGASHGGQALELVRQAPPDLIVLDVQMPHLDGRGFAQAYRRLPGPHAPIILLTASDMGAAVAGEIAAVALVVKPFDIDALAARVRACLGGSARGTGDAGHASAGRAAADGRGDQTVRASA